jgi:galactokinase
MRKQSIIVEAPARICLYGDHQDYLGLPVITCAIDRYIYLKAEKIDKPHFEIITPDIEDQRIINLDEEMSSFSEDDHYKSGIFVMKKEGYKIKEGYRISINGNIPINAGLSSSSAIIVSWIQFLHAAFGGTNSLSKEELGKLAFQAEVEEHHAPGGKMDQYAIALGGILFMNMGKNFSYTSLKTDLPSLIIGVSGDPKQTNETLRRAKNGALEAIDEIKRHRENFQIRNIQENDLVDYLPLVSKGNRNFFKAAVINHETTKSAHLELQKTHPDFSYLGKIMNRHHHTLQKYLGTTTVRIDSMVEKVLNAGAYGAKIVGSGGGGCVVALCKEGEEYSIINAFKSGGAQDAYQVKPSAGTSVNILS